MMVMTRFLIRIYDGFDMVFDMFCGGFDMVFDMAYDGFDLVFDMVCGGFDMDFDMVYDGFDMVLIWIMMVLIGSHGLMI